ncbi:MAG: hypothetical protein EOP83_02635 [Verrucomicrobiaceae bacterium]|nr:MAG: hypothetical protein EOP83_02635 [Verrucomicrobiaceae bacterium]
MPVELAPDIPAVGDNPTVITVPNWRERNLDSQAYHNASAWLQGENAHGLYYACLRNDYTLVCYFSDPMAAFEFKMRFG